jgi:hypothetical protein
MKKLILSFAIMMAGIGAFAQPGDAAKKSAAAVAKFSSESIDLGKILQDHPTTATFEITNTGKEPLLIEQANPTCGCTIGDYTKEPIAPGNNGFIKATYNAKNLGMFEKHLNVKFAGYDMQMITIKGEVIKDENATVAPVATPVAASTAAETMVAEKPAAATKTSTTAPVKKSTAPATKTKKP